MATATKESVAAQPARGTRRLRAGGSTSFLVFEDNGGIHRWKIVAGDGTILAQSRSVALRARSTAQAGAE